MDKPIVHEEYMEQQEHITVFKKQRDYIQFNFDKLSTSKKWMHRLRISWWAIELVITVMIVTVLLVQLVINIFNKDFTNLATVILWAYFIYDILMPDFARLYDLTVQKAYLDCYKNENKGEL